MLNKRHFLDVELYLVESAYCSIPDHGMQNRIQHTLLQIMFKKGYLEHLMTTNKVQLYIKMAEGQLSRSQIGLAPSL